tara:strand:+ start:1136 stop:1393 length:258 start_codon:yes stop_codon:yes gene_type:complete
MKWYVGRFINGICLNDFEYVLDGKDGEPMEYPDKWEALEFLKNNTGEDLTALEYEEVYGYYIVDEDVVMPDVTRNVTRNVTRGIE